MLSGSRNESAQTRGPITPPESLLVLQCHLMLHEASRSLKWLAERPKRTPVAHLVIAKPLHFDATACSKCLLREPVPQGRLQLSDVAAYLNHHSFAACSFQPSGKQRKQAHVLQ